LFNELPGILNWAIEGALLWEREGLTMPWKIRHPVAEYRTEEDVLAEFISEHIVVGAVGVPHSDVFTTYLKWAAKAGIWHTMTAIGLAKKLRERGWKDKRNNKGVFWFGIALKTKR
jgi:putative DNA primase/helicase